MPGWTDLRILVATEFAQSREKVRDPAELDALQREFAATSDDEFARSGNAP